MPTLFEPIQLGAIAAPNRILMAPLTRGRNTRDHVPTDLMVEYYRQRASAGLIISEATGISLQGLGWPYAPGIWSDAQVEGWRRVTEAVHGAGGRIMCQLWHMGRVVHPSLPGRAQPVSASATTAPGMAMTYEGPQPHVQARPLDAGEIPALLEDYRRATHNAMAAGFDGVQLHGANGYLIDQFLRNAANQRRDSYGGAPENRIRLLMDVTKAMAGVAGADRTAVRISPNGTTQGVTDNDPAPLFSLAAEALSSLGLAFLEVKEPPPGGTRGTPDHPPVAPVIRKMFKGPLVLNSDFDAVRAPAAMAEGIADAIAFGRHFISNPDLVYRLEHGLKLAPNVSDTWYTQGPQGYVDYPAVA
jgi:2,4-dienoyl-CoA reductase-like NADH-dependent reductase (Old Yellow Enzyme family)